MYASHSYQDEHNLLTLLEGESEPNVTVQFPQPNVPPRNTIPPDASPKKMPKKIRVPHDICTKLSRSESKKNKKINEYSPLSEGEEELKYSPLSDSDDNTSSNRWSEYSPLSNAKNAEFRA